MKQKLKFLFFFTLFLALSTSCKKECDFPEEELRAGEIVKDAYVLGLNSGGVKSVYFEFDSLNPIRVSFDKGFSYVPVDFEKYTVMNFPVLVGCNTYFEKEVTFTSAPGKTTYTLRVESCPDCEEQYLQENWVLVNKFPKTNFVVYERK